ncbi:hypothetical protein FOIG_09329 [Fusarium odoratissimum NRRL 54006]|uniref:Uncharacterized protein n=1 Tax=Fusarium odoratissimum (strain NRRL 54006) TaxID=1089451 RepID=X0JBM2_FUSO5|nr:uncharacterized protein FOIG_09329 [Fusarium odoratissimum NRRL 54006]EXL98572.1 hypothetical protein FOIG_09329 [Fusarium odoratissimum NRRL 54006]
MLDLTATTFSSRCSQALGARQRQREQHNDTTADVATAEATAQDVDVAPPLQPPQHPGSGSGSDSVCVRAEASEDLDVWALDGPLDDPTALPWPSSLDEDWPGLVVHVDTLQSQFRGYATQSREHRLRLRVHSPPTPTTSTVNH